MFSNINFPKIVTVLAVIFGIALGACGLTALVASTAAGQYLMPLGMLELGVMIVSGVLLLIAVIVWVLATAFGNLGSDSSEPQRLFDNSRPEDTRGENDKDDR